jgi:hypothetical protein
MPYNAFFGVRQVDMAPYWLTMLAGHHKLDTRDLESSAFLEEKQNESVRLTSRLSDMGRFRDKTRPDAAE